jgi:hypothetical protein
MPSAGSTPLWIIVLLGILAVLGTVGGAWGGQIIAGQNEARRWQRERQREREAYWRDKRFEAYMDYFDAAKNTLLTIWRTAVDESDRDDLMQDIGSQIPSSKVIEMIAPTDVIKLCDELEESLWALARSYAKDTDADGFDSVLDLTDAQLSNLKMMFRRDLGVVEGEPRHVLPKLTEVRKSVYAAAKQQ